jgi:hypothetical protein
LIEIDRTVPEIHTDGGGILATNRDKMSLFGDDPTTETTRN